jgi:hypothetical protein
LHPIPGLAGIFGGGFEGGDLEPACALLGMPIPGIIHHQ